MRLKALRAARGRRAQDASGRRVGAGGRSPTRCSASTTARALPPLQQLAQTPGRVHARVRRARPRRAEGRRVGAAAALDARAGEGATAVVASSVDPRARRRSARPRRRRRSIAVLTDDKTDPNVRLEAVTALGDAEGDRGAAGRPGSADRRLAGDAARPRSAPPPRSIRRRSCRALRHGAGSHWTVRAALAERARHAAAGRRGRARCARCSTTRTSGSSPRC